MEIIIDQWTLGRRDGAPGFDISSSTWHTNANQKNNQPTSRSTRKKHHEPFRHEEAAWGDESTLRRSRAAAAIIRLYLFYLPPPPLPHFPPRLSTVEDSTAARRSDPLDSAGRQGRKQPTNALVGCGRGGRGVREGGGGGGRGFRWKARPRRRKRRRKPWRFLQTCHYKSL